MAKNWDAARDDVGVLVMNGLALVADITRHIVTFWCSLTDAMPTLTTEFHYYLR
jgi:hypothetical protein